MQFLQSISLEVVNQRAKCTMDPLKLYKNMMNITNLHLISLSLRHNPRTIVMKPSIMKIPKRFTGGKGPRKVAEVASKVGG